jgi:hypothetical protein
VSNVSEQNNGPEVLTNGCVFEDLDLTIRTDEISKAIHELELRVTDLIVFLTNLSLNEKHK